MTRYDFYKEVEENRQIVCKKDKWGVIDENGIEIIPAIYDNVIYFSEDQVFGVVLKKGLHSNEGIFDINGKELLPVEYYLYTRWAYHYNLFIICKEDKYGLFNPSIGKVIECKFDSICQIDFCDSMVIAKLNGNYGVYTVTGKEVVPVIYTELIYSTEHFFCKKDGKYGLLNKEGVVVVPCRYDKELKIINDCIICSINGKYGLLKLDGTEILPCEYDDISYLCSRINHFLITKKKKQGIASDKGEIIPPEKYEILKEGYDNNLITRINGKFGLIDIEGNEVIPNIYDSLGQFDLDSKYYEVGLNCKYGLVNSNGVVVVEPKYSSIERFWNGFSSVGKGLEKHGLINKEGEEILPTIYQIVKPIAVCKKSHEIIYNPSASDTDDLQTNLVIVKENSKYGIRKTNGQILLLSKYDDICEIYDEYAKVKLNDHFGFAYFEC